VAIIPISGHLGRQVSAAGASQALAQSSAGGGRREASRQMDQRRSGLENSSGGNWALRKGQAEISIRCGNLADLCGGVCFTGSVGLMGAANMRYYGECISPSRMNKPAAPAEQNAGATTRSNRAIEHFSTIRLSTNGKLPFRQRQVKAETYPAHHQHIKRTRSAHGTARFTPRYGIKQRTRLDLHCLGGTQKGHTPTWPL
jgi:hypothetical protein